MDAEQVAQVEQGKELGGEQDDQDRPNRNRQELVARDTTERVAPPHPDSDLGAGVGIHLVLKSGHTTTAFHTNQLFRTSLGR